MSDVYIASYGHRYSDACGTFISHNESALADAIESAMKYEADEIIAMCDNPEHTESDETCDWCETDIVWWGTHRVSSVGDLGGFRLALRAMRDLRDQEQRGGTVTSVESY